MKKLALMLIAALFLTACSKQESPDTSAATQGAPAHTQQASSGDNGLLWGLGGFLLGQALSSKPTSQVVERHYHTTPAAPATQKQAPAPAKAPAVVPKAPAYKPVTPTYKAPSAPTPKTYAPSSSYKSMTMSRPSYSGSSFRSSGFRR